MSEWSDEDKILTISPTSQFLGMEFLLKILYLCPDLSICLPSSGLSFVKSILVGTHKAWVFRPSPRIEHPRGFTQFEDLFVKKSYPWEIVTDAAKPLHMIASLWEHKIGVKAPELPNLVSEVEMAAAKAMICAYVEEMQAEHGPMHLKDGYLLSVEPSPPA